MLERTNEGYASFVAEFVDGLDSATRAHVAVAYQNLIPNLSGMARAFHGRDMPFTIEIFIRNLEQDLPIATDEINSRRLSWFLMAALVARLEKTANETPSTVDVGALVWTIILTEYPRLKILLPRNVVWSEEEKEWFDLSQTDAILIERGVNYDVPPIFSKTKVMADFARQMGLFYNPLEDRSGLFVP